MSDDETQTPAATPPAQPAGCERCRAPIRAVEGFPALCDRCIELSGSGCSG